MLEELHGRTPTRLQLVSTWGVAAAAFVFTLYALGTDWRSILLAVIAADWCGGIIANAAESTRVWWRRRAMGRRIFIAVHLIEIPIVLWLAEGGLAFWVLMLVLAAKLSVFMLGRESQEDDKQA